MLSASQKKILFYKASTVHVEIGDTNKTSKCTSQGYMHLYSLGREHKVNSVTITNMRGSLCGKQLCLVCVSGCFWLDVEKL